MNLAIFRAPLATAAMLAALPILPAFAVEISAGAAKTEFQLPKGVPLAGYGKRHGEASTGVHDPVGVRALVIRSSDAGVAFVSSDLLIVDENLYNQVEKRLQASTGQPLALFVSATHTHSGPGAYGRRFAEKISMGHYDARVAEAIAAAIASAIEQADAARQPAALGCAAAATEGLIKNRVEEDGFSDSELSVCVFQSSEGKPAAVIVNFAAHPTTLGAWQKALSADYPGVVMKRIEERWPGAIAFFFAGAVGDQAPVKSGDGFERAEFIGKPLAVKALELIARIQAQPMQRLAVSQETFKLPKARVRLNKRLALPGFIGQAMVDDDASISAAIVGNSAWFGVPCDLAASLGKRLKQTATEHDLFPLILGFTNDYIGYCMAESVYQTGEYEARMAFNGPKAGEMLADKLAVLMKSLALKQ